MTSHVRTLLLNLREVGWAVCEADKDGVPPMPYEIRCRYPACPHTLLDLATSFRTVVSPDEKAWFLCSSDYAGLSESAYSWNEWELLSLEQAKDDEEWRKTIKGFWDAHIPILLSVKRGYAFYALQIESGAIVEGEEPDFEEVSEVSGSLTEFLGTLSFSGAEQFRLL